jgi:amino acid adenylation domain-containing protein
MSEVRQSTAEDSIASVQDRSREISAESRLLLASAHDSEALQGRIDDILAHVASGQHRLDDVAYTLVAGRQAMQMRAALVLTQEQSPAEAWDNRSSVHIGRGKLAPGKPSIGFMFPGQGSQFVGMGRQLYKYQSRFRALFDRCDSVLEPLMGVRLRELLFAADGGSDGEAQRVLTQTTIAQPALFVIEYALADLLLHYGVRPDVLLGHSSGEFAAACLAGVFELEDVLRLVAERGRLMQSLPSGSMLTVKAELQQVEALCGDGIDLAAHNAPGLIVVSGSTERVEQLASELQAQGIDTRRLHTSHAFHSAMMDPILEPFARAVDKAKPRPPNIPIVSTMTGKLLSHEEACSSTYWAKQLRSPVRFMDAVASACETAQCVLVEVGPGVALTTFATRQREGVARPRKVIATLGHPEGDVPALDATLRCVGELWIQGLDVNWEVLYGASARRLVRLPTYRYTRRRHWIEPTPIEAPGGAQPVRAETPGASAGATRTQAAAPEVQLRERLLAMLGSRLGTQLSEGDLESTLLELGFDSMALSQLAAKLRQDFGVRVPIRRLFGDLNTASLLADHLLAEGASVAVAPAAPGPASIGSTAAMQPLASEAGALAQILARLDRMEQRFEGALAASSQDAAPGAHGSTPTAIADAREGIPLTTSQQEIWVAARVGGPAASVAYNECRAFRFRGPLDLVALTQSLEEISRRHEALRQTFSADGERCITHRSMPIPLSNSDLRNEDASTRAARLQDLMREQVSAPFDLATGPLCRALLVSMADDEAQLIMCAHHIAVDGSSWEILIRELSELYSARIEARPANLPRAASFAAYAAAEFTERSSAEAREGERFWLDHLRGQTDDLDLPIDEARPAHRSFRSTRSDQELSASVVERVRAAATRASCTAQTLLLGAFQLLLYRLSRQTDLIVGIPTSGQAAAGFESLVGHCVHVLPLRTLIDPDKRVSQHLTELHGAMLDGLDHQQATFTELLHKLKRPRDPSRPALIQVAFGMGRSQKRPTFAGLDTWVYVVPRISESFELYVYATDVGGAFEVSWSYSTDLFSEATIGVWQRCFATIIDEFIAAPDARTLAEISSVAKSDRDRLLDLALGASVAHSPHVPVHRMIAQQAMTQPNKEAIHDIQGAHSYLELDHRANRIARWLLGRGLAPNALVGVCLDRSFDLIAVLIGVWRAGLGYVPLDPTFPAHHLEIIMQDSACGIVITSEALRDRVTQAAAVCSLEDIAGAITAESPQPPALDYAGEDTAYVIFTSGSTGRPKGVQIPQRAVENFIASMRVAPGCTESDRLLAITTISFDISVLELFLPLASGGHVTIVTRDHVINPPVLQQLLAEQNISIMQATPATWQMLFDGGWAGQPGLKILCGGEAFPKHLAERFLASCGEVWNVYGPTETTVWSTVKNVQDASDLSIGRPIDNTSVYVLDEQLRLVPPGAHGELWIGGAGVARGYLGRPELTAERFKASPFRDGDTIYRTGDLARVAGSGEIECLGRVDFQVKIRGFRIELGAIETALLERSEIATCAVVAREGKDGNKLLAAYLVAAEGHSIDVDALRQTLSAKLPAYMIPASYCVLDALPMTPNNKIDRKALPDPQPISTETTPPRDKLERDMLEIWAEMLEYDDLGIHDNFYLVGGHSLMAIRLIALANERFRTSLSVDALFSNPTVAGFSAVVRADVGDPASVRGKPASGHRGLFLLQQGREGGFPLFLIHGDQANGLLLPRLTKEQEVWGYHHQGSNGDRVALTTVEALAEHINREWIERHGTRPCVLAGHSFGAVLAYHVAVLREQQGLPTPSLVIIDARHPDVFAGRNMGLGAKQLRRRMRVLSKYLEARRNLAHAIWYLARGKGVPLDLRSSYILGTYHLATLRYEPPEWRGTLHIIRSEEYTHTSPFDGWDRVALGKVTRVVIPGSHLSCVRTAEGVGRVADVLHGIFEELQHQTGSLVPGANTIDAHSRLS